MGCRRIERAPLHLLPKRRKPKLGGKNGHAAQFKPVSCSFLLSNIEDGLDVFDSTKNGKLNMGKQREEGGRVEDSKGSGKR